MTHLEVRRPLIIVGAGRSGTNALRDALCHMDAFHTWPCDEINYIWRHGNRDHPSDELTPSDAPAGRRYIRRAFEKRQRVAPGSTIVEKTCANSLRVGFVHEVIPEARFVHIRRTPVDSVPSAMKRWTAELDISYVLRKARFVPPSDLTVYAGRYLSSHLARASDDHGQLSTWGPRFAGMDEIVRSHDLVSVAAMQWAACVLRAHEQLRQISIGAWMEVSYEDLVSCPAEVLSEITRFSGRIPDEQQVAAAAATIKGDSVGKGRRSLDREDLDRILELTTDVAQINAIPL
jgi:hypothetical protein